MVEAKQKKQLQPLSTGDGVAIAALVLFILIWAGGWITVFALSDGPKNSNTSWWAGVLLTIIIFGPPFWAMNRVREIIRKEAD